MPPQMNEEKTLIRCKGNRNMSKRKLIGIVFGTIAGILDVTPMIIQKLSLDANISAFSMWVIVGLIISSIDFKIPSVVKGIIVSFLILLPTAILIAEKTAAAKT